jgi:uncharacterized repeat protein (TIGR03803 family)
MKFRISRWIAIAVAFALAGQSRAATPNLTTLVSFCSLPNCADGSLPQVALIADANGNLFGTTSLGGAYCGEDATCGGTVFEIVKTASGYASTPTTLVSFCSLPNCADGSRPQAALIADANGNLFGTTVQGGAASRGTVFEIVKIASGYASTPTTLVSFCSLPNCADGATPFAGLIADANGNLFGTTEGGGAARRGTVFEIVKTASGYPSTPAILVSFCSLPNCADGQYPLTGLIADANGNLFGTTVQGGAAGRGTVFEIVKIASGYASTPTTLVSFCSLPNCADGATPTAGLIADANGNLFGTTYVGGPGAYGGVFGGGGTVFEIVKTASGYASTPTTLVSFCSLPNCTDGASPYASLIADANGNLFGTTLQGGAYASYGVASGAGTVFEIVNTASGYASTPTTLVSFCNGGMFFNCTADGEFPEAGLIADANGNLFGTTSDGGASGFGGTVFEITGSGFVPPPLFAGTPGKVGCIVKSNATLRGNYHGFNNAAADLGYPSVRALEMAILSYCWGV